MSATFFERILTREEVTFKRFDAEEIETTDRAITLLEHIKENKQAGWNEYKDIKETLESLLDKGYTKEMIQTVLEQN